MKCPKCNHTLKYRPNVGNTCFIGFIYYCEKCEYNVVLSHKIVNDTE